MRKLFKKLLTQRVDDRFTITNLARPYSIFGRLGVHMILTIEGLWQWRMTNGECRLERQKTPEKLASSRPLCAAQQGMTGNECATLDGDCGRRLVGRRSLCAAQRGMTGDDCATLDGDCARRLVGIHEFRWREGKELARPFFIHLQVKLQDGAHSDRDGGKLKLVDFRGLRQQRIENRAVCGG